LPAALKGRRRHPDRFTVAVIMEIKAVVVLVEGYEIGSRRLKIVAPAAGPVTNANVFDRASRPPVNMPKSVRPSEL
jgi:hypothetical protein